MCYLRHLTRRHAKASLLQRAFHRRQAYKQLHKVRALRFVQKNLRRWIVQRRHEKMRVAARVIELFWARWLNTKRTWAAMILQRAWRSHRDWHLQMGWVRKWMHLQEIVLF